MESFHHFNIFLRALKKNQLRKIKTVLIYIPGMEKSAYKVKCSEVIHITGHNKAASGLRHSFLTHHPCCVCVLFFYVHQCHWRLIDRVCKQFVIFITSTLWSTPIKTLFAAPFGETEDIDGGSRAQYCRFVAQHGPGILCYSIRVDYMVFYICLLVLLFRLGASGLDAMRFPGDICRRFQVAW